MKFSELELKKTELIIWPWSIRTLSFLIASWGLTPIWSFSRRIEIAPKLNTICQSFCFSNSLCFSLCRAWNSRLKTSSGTRMTMLEYKKSPDKKVNLRSRKSQPLEARLLFKYQRGLTRTRPSLWPCPSQCLLSSRKSHQCLVGISLRTLKNEAKKRKKELLTFWMGSSCRRCWLWFVSLSSFLFRNSFPVFSTKIYITIIQSRPSNGPCMCPSPFDFGFFSSSICSFYSQTLWPVNCGKQNRGNLLE